MSFLPCHLMSRLMNALHIENNLVKKFPDLDFSRHATWAYLPNLSTCLASPLVSFLHTLHLLSTQPSSTYAPSTAQWEKRRLSSIAKHNNDSANHMEMVFGYCPKNFNHQLLIGDWIGQPMHLKLNIRISAEWKSHGKRAWKFLY